ncbi:MAG: class I SAM-dependent methyltransferase [Candidatus Dadabacteria bacterium]|nr:MAG: class I SAM-dependent methyltransferase [Candidatus Dadabacteria bacterium]
MLQQTPEFLRVPERMRSVDRLFRNRVLEELGRIAPGPLVIADEAGAVQLGAGDAAPVWIDVRRPRFYRRVALGGTLGLAESWIDGDWECADLERLFTLFASGSAVAELERGGGWLVGRIQRFAQWRNRNTRRGARRNIEAHYDLGNDFYARMLDATMMYSCAIWDNEHESLETAQVRKLDHICRKLGLTSEHHLLEIGTGWGAMAAWAAAKYGCRVTTTTISPAQHAFATERIQRLGCADRVTVLFEDYRDLKGRYDRIVSIEMIEAVGREGLPTYFRTLDRLLADDGLALVQAIVLNDDRYEQHIRELDMIQKYVFPGSVIPSVSVLAEAARAMADCRLIHLEDIGPHYARTLREWDRRFSASWPEIRGRRGFDDRFWRIWRYYLNYCAAGFASGYLGDVQLLWARQTATRPRIGLPAAEPGTWLEASATC